MTQFRPSRMTSRSMPPKRVTKQPAARRKSMPRCSLLPGQGEGWASTIFIAKIKRPINNDQATLASSFFAPAHESGDYFLGFSSKFLFVLGKGGYNGKASECVVDLGLRFFLSTCFYKRDFIGRI
ncbi:hypothetical protein CDAR_592171 [Caerostris darwini]|uniref:Uncharacterized protein n=1 Tax=Caerostris darwini TaxID=1538125 RepID=A0AAV4W1K1_9ARAC|nr:hypothetical protein CDAR_592171 [Caerostris darwini]